jgi:tagatose 6-phosphate kinase
VITVVTLNPALDVTHHVDGVDWSGVNRPVRVTVAPGGKGVNVARTLHALGEDALLLGLAGGAAGEALRSGLRAAGVPAQLTEIAGETRRTFAVVDTSRAEVAIFNEPGPPVSGAEHESFLDVYRKALSDSSAVVLSGSLPLQLPPDAYAGLITTAKEAGVPALLDTSGAALLPAIAAGPAVAKPNLAELGSAVGRALDAHDLPAVLDAAYELRDQGSEAVVVSMGQAGLLAVTSEGSWHAVPHPVAGNPTGAGDAVVAGLARGLTLGWPWAERLRHAAALGAATTAAAVAGEFGQDEYVSALNDIHVTYVGTA